MSDDLENCRRLLDRNGWPGYCDTTVYFRLSMVLQSLKETTRERDAMWERTKDMGRMRSALESIAANTCCGQCQEAALVAKSALADKPSP